MDSYTIPLGFLIFAANPNTCLYHRVAGKWQICNLSKVCKTLELTSLISAGQHYLLLSEQKVCKLNKMLYVKHITMNAQ